MAKPRAILKQSMAVKNIAKITNTMQMIATARFKQAHTLAVAARPYTDRLTKLIAELTDAAGEFRHPLLESRPAKRVAVLAVAGNRGLCGGFNSGVSKKLAALRASLSERGLETELHVVGKKLADMLAFQQVAMASLHTNLDDRPKFADVDEVVTPFIQQFENGEIDELHVVYTKFLTSARQQPTAEQVLPLTREVKGDGPQAQQDTIFSPDAASILSALLPRSVRLHVFQAILDSAVSQQTARMVAMKAATDNAHDMITELTRKYNRSRQTQITTELTEIMGGAAALE